MRNRVFGALEIKSADPSTRTFTGTLSTSHLDKGGWFYKDIVYPGAFKRTLDHFRKAKDPYIPLLDSHSPFSVMDAYGTLVEAEEQLTGKTLTYEKEQGGDFEVPEMLLDTQWKIIDGNDGDRLLDRLRSGAIRKMSMGYEPMRSEDIKLKGHGNVRVLKEVKLREGSLVIFPMNDNASVDLDSVKSIFTDALRAGQLTRKQLQELFTALPEESTADEAPTTQGLAPDDPKRLSAEALLRELSIKCLTSHDVRTAKFA